MKKKEEIYVSTDIETNGNVAGFNAMLSLGSVAYCNGEEIGYFYDKLIPPKDLIADPSIMEWWAHNQEAYEEATKGARDPQASMISYRQWLEFLPGMPIFVGSPGAWDFSFVFYYLRRYTKRPDDIGYSFSPFKHRALDIRTFAMAVNKGPFAGDKTGNELYKSLVKDINNPCPHHALYDAREQGEIFMKLMKLNGNLT